MGKIIQFLVLVAMLGGAYLFISPYRTLQKLTYALENENVEAVDKYVDFDAVKANMKDDFTVRMGIDPGGNLLGDTATSLAGAFLDLVVSPQTMVTVFKEKDRRDHMGLTMNIGDLITSGTWRGLSTLVLYNANGQATMLLERSGLFHWDVKAMRLK